MLLDALEVTVVLLGGELRWSLCSSWTLEDCVNHLLIAVKTPNKNHSKKGGFSLSRVPEHSPLWQEVAGHIAAPGRKPRQGDADAQLLLS